MAEYSVISADSHVEEPGDLWTRYIERKYRDQAPRVVEREDGTRAFLIEGLDPARLGTTASLARKMQEVTREGGWDPEARLKDMQQDGLDAEVLYTSRGLNMYRIKDLDYQWACFRAYNDWLADFCKAASTRLLGVALISLVDVDLAVQELRRAVNNGLRGASISTRPNQPFSDRRYDPFWAEAQEMDIPVSLHILTAESDDRAFASSGSAKFRELYGAEDEGNHGMVRYAIRPWIIQESLGILIASGVMERFPKLKFVSAENDICWAAHYLARFDHYYENHRRWSGAGPTMTMRPGEYFRRQAYLTFIRDKPGVDLRHYIGIDNLMWSSDYPHPESTWPESQKCIQWQMGSVPEDERRKMLCENVTRLYRLS